LYTFFFRMSPAPALALFDAPDAGAACTRRIRSNSPLQALTLLNDKAFLEFAVAMAERISKEAPGSDREKLEYGFLLALGRKPNSSELDRMSSFLAKRRQEYQGNPALAAALIAKEPAPVDRSQILEGGTETTGAQAVGDPQQNIQLAAWTAVSRVLLNLDEFMTRE
jgi:hypothetical protein